MIIKFYCMIKQNIISKLQSWFDHDQFDDFQFWNWWFLVAKENCNGYLF